MRERPEVFHLISAHEVAPNWHLYATYVALCGKWVETASMAEIDCPNECECELSPSMAYCPDCLHAAIEQNHRAGIDADGAVDLAPRIDPSVQAAAATAT